MSSTCVASAAHRLISDSRPAAPAEGQLAGSNLSPIGCNLQRSRGSPSSAANLTCQIQSDPQLLRDIIEAEIDVSIVLVH